MSRDSSSMWRHHTAVALVVATLVLPGSCSAAQSAPADSSSEGHKPPVAPRLSIAVRPAVVYAGSTIRLQVAAEPVLTRHDRCAWKTSAGLLLYDDLAEVAWKAPREPGAVVVTLTVAAADDTRTVATTIEVRPPSTREMVWIPAGEFIQGDILGTRHTGEVKTFQNASDEPFRKVHLDGYWIDRFAVTHEKYRDFLQDALAQEIVRVDRLGVWGEFEGSWVPFYYFRSYEELVRDYLRTVNARRPKFFHWISWDERERRFRIEPGKEMTPAVDVSWFGAAAYARFYGKELPSEAQWEKAARGPDGRRFPWGSNPPTAYHVNINHQRGYEPLPVGSYRPFSDSPYGVSDMVAGLFEWTGDWFNAYYYKDTEGRRPQRDPQGTFWGRAHTIRSFPYALFHPGVESDEALSFRYHWNFEFFVGDIFANRETTFRTVISPPDRRYEYDDPF